MKRTVFFFSFCLLFVLTHAQQLTLDVCRQKTQKNYPLVRQYGLIEQSSEYNLSNASKGYLPQLSLSGKATYQSAVTELPVKVPGVNIKGMAKDQYQLMAELKQDIWDGGEIRAKKRQLKTSAEVEREELNVNMYALNERVDQIYFGILMLDEQLKQNELLTGDFARSFQKVSAYLTNGVANQADLDAVSVELLNTKQKRLELEASRKAYLDMLSLFIGEGLSQQVVLQKPLFNVPSQQSFSGAILQSFSYDASSQHSSTGELLKSKVSADKTAKALSSDASLQQPPFGKIWKQSSADDSLYIYANAALSNNRPEMTLFDARSRDLQIRNDALNARLMPHFGLFVQGAYGNPGLNMLENKFTPYYVAGVRLSWNFGSLYTLRNDKRLIDNGIRQVENSRDVFLFNTALQSVQQTNAIESMRKQMTDDDEIIRLRINIRRAAEAKVANGTMTVTDMLKEITAESMARQTKALHEIQLLMNIWDLKYTLNK